MRNDPSQRSDGTDGNDGNNNADHDCPFCAIINKQQPAFTFVEDGAAIAFLDHNPINPGHTLITPRRHVEAFTELTPGEVLAVFTLAQYTARALIATLEAEGVNYMINQGAIAGQQVFHVHCHVLPRYATDAITFKRSQRVAPDSELEPIHSRLGRFCMEHPLCERVKSEE